MPDELPQHGRHSATDWPKLVVTTVVALLMGAFLQNVLDSKSVETRLAAVETRTQAMEPRVLSLETNAARLDQRVMAIESKVEDIWRVVVLGQRPERQ